MSETPEEPIADDASEPKSEVKSGDEAMPSNPKSVGWCKLQQKTQLDSWDPENKEYWKVRVLILARLLSSMAGRT